MNKIVIMIVAILTIAINETAIGGELYPQSDLEFPKGSTGDIIENPSSYLKPFLEKHTIEELKEIYYHHSICGGRVRKHFNDKGSGFSMDEYDDLMQICNKILDDADIRGSDVKIFLLVGSQLQWPNLYTGGDKKHKKK